MTLTEDHGRRIAAFVLIGLGILFLLGQLGLGFNFNWWAIFIAWPGVLMLRNVYRAYRSKESLSNNEMVQGAIGLFLLLLAISFLFNLSFLWNFWPLILIAIGLAMLFGYGRAGEKSKRDEE
jgi:predicted membrane protein